LKKRVIFTGRQKNVREFLDIAEIYVQPTLNKGRMEGAPIAIQEAMANGKVVLGSNIPGIRDQLVDFPQFLFNPGDVLDLKNKLVQYISNNIKQNIKIGEKFIDYAVSNYDLSIEKENLQKYYLNLIKTTHL
jgi:glycosyltransferase involved in cell wall biosynthesis